MMIIDVRKLNAKKEYSGELVFDYEAPETLIDIPYVKFATPIKVEATYDLLEDDSLELTGRISFTLEGKCSRCLKDSKQEVIGELDAYFEPRKDCEDYSYSNGRIDLREAIEDAVMAAMPYVILCQEDCKGIQYSEDKPTIN